jgi:hypothetical protein
MGNWLSDSKPGNVAPPVITSSLPVAPTVATQTPQPATDFIQHLNATGSTGVSTMEARTKKRKRPYKPVYPKNKRPRTSQPLRSGSGVPIQTVSDSTALRSSNDIPFPVADAVEYADEIDVREKAEQEEQEEEREMFDLRKKDATVDVKRLKDELDATLPLEAKHSDEIKDASADVAQLEGLLAAEADPWRKEGMRTDLAVKKGALKDLQQQHSNLQKERLQKSNQRKSLKVAYKI